MISRKERLLDEGLTRIKLAESALKGLQSTHLVVVAEQKDRLQALEDEKRLAEEARAKAESEYESLRGGMKSMSDGWRTELEWIKTDVRRAQTTHERELDEARQKHSTRAFPLLPLPLSLTSSFLPTQSSSSLKLEKRRMRTPLPRWPHSPRLNESLLKLTVALSPSLSRTSTPWSSGRKMAVRKLRRSH